MGSGAQQKASREPLYLTQTAVCSTLPRVPCSDKARTRGRHAPPGAWEPPPHWQPAWQLVAPLTDDVQAPVPQLAPRLLCLGPAWDLLAPA